MKGGRKERGGLTNDHAVRVPEMLVHFLHLPVLIIYRALRREHSLPHIIQTFAIVITFPRLGVERNHRQESQLREENAILHIVPRPFWQLAS